MPVTKVKEDEYGLYVRAQGCIFRPVEGKYTYLFSLFLSTGTGKLENALERNKRTQFKVGETIKAHHISQSPHGKLKKLEDDYFEIWASHENGWQPKE